MNETANQHDTGFGHTNQSLNYKYLNIYGDQLSLEVTFVAVTLFNNFLCTLNFINPTVEYSISSINTKI